MPSTALQTSNPIAGITILPGLQVSPYGAALTNIKAYNFTLATSTNFTSTAILSAAYTVSGLTTNDIPVSIVPTTGILQAAPESMAITGSSQLTVGWMAGSTSATWAITAQAVTLFTVSYYTQASSTTT